ncbi:hypothetical protein LY78DRAFT_404590 [Colletotrichum sublineola]|nr:hypothetical protein LY78DRAFT_404590 [Colletotrichum sublineola]
MWMGRHADCRAIPRGEAAGRRNGRAVLGHECRRDAMATHTESVESTQIGRSGGSWSMMINSVLLRSWAAMAPSSSGLSVRPNKGATEPKRGETAPVGGAYVGSRWAMESFLDPSGGRGSAVLFRVSRVLGVGAVLVRLGRSQGYVGTQTRSDEHRNESDAYLQGDGPAVLCLSTF